MKLRYDAKKYPRLHYYEMMRNAECMARSNRLQETYAESRRKWMTEHPLVECKTPDTNMTPEEMRKMQARSFA